MDGKKAVRYLEQNVPKRWDFKTGNVNGGPAGWARSPNGTWEVSVVRNPHAEGAYNVELNKLDARGGGVKGLADGATVKKAAGVPRAVKRMVESATGGQYRVDRDGSRRGTVEDEAGLFDGLF